MLIWKGFITETTRSEIFNLTMENEKLSEAHVW